MLDSMYNKTVKLLKNHIFLHENVKILPSFTQRFNGCNIINSINN